MCGVAQEDPSNSETVYNKPWHVVVTFIKVSVLSNTQTICHRSHFLFHVNFPSPARHRQVFLVLWIHRESELGADGCSLLCQSQHGPRPREGGHTVRSVPERDIYIAHSTAEAEYFGRGMVKKCNNSKFPSGFPKPKMAFSKKVVMHPEYNTRALRHRNVSEFYDYDVALVHVNQSIPLSWEAR